MPKSSFCFKFSNRIVFKNPFIGQKHCDVFNWFKGEEKQIFMLFDINVAEIVCSELLAEMFLSSRGKFLYGRVQRLLCFV